MKKKGSSWMKDSYSERAEVFVSSADCRTFAFLNASDATSIYVKGSEFTIDSLVNGSVYDSSYYHRIIINRLAPQDYHRYHMPFTG